MTFQGVVSMIRRFGEPPITGQSYQLRPGAYAILARGTDVLLTLQTKPYVEYQLPGGGIDLGENGINALHREVKEETGWKISNPRHVGCFRRFVYMPEYEMWAEKLCHVYLADPVYQLHEPIEPFHQVQWMTAKQAALILGNEGDRFFVNQILV